MAISNLHPPTTNTTTVTTTTTATTTTTTTATTTPVMMNNAATSTLPVHVHVQHQRAYSMDFSVSSHLSETSSIETSSNESLNSSHSDNSKQQTQTQTQTQPQTQRKRPNRRLCRRRTRNRVRQTNKKNESEKNNLSLEEQAQYVAMDCEMVGVGSYGNVSSVARVTLVGWNGETIMDEYIQQEEEVTDYRTFISGITQLDIEQKATVTLEECQEKVQRLIQGKILIGHALKNDKKALGITHPWSCTRDTAKYEPFMYVRFDDGILWPRKLKDLAKEKCGKDIQVFGQPHSAYEDAVAAMDLYKSVRSKWEKVMNYKKKKTYQIEQQQQKQQKYQAQLLQKQQQNDALTLQ